MEIRNNFTSTHNNESIWNFNLKYGKRLRKSIGRKVKWLDYESLTFGWVLSMIDSFIFQLPLQFTYLQFSSIFSCFFFVCQFLFKAKKITNLSSKRKTRCKEQEFKYWRKKWCHLCNWALESQTKLRNDS